MMQTVSPRVLMASGRYVHRGVEQLSVPSPIGLGATGTTVASAELLNVTLLTDHYETQGF